MSHGISSGSCKQTSVGRHLFLHARFWCAWRPGDKWSSSPVLEPPLAALFQSPQTSHLSAGLLHVFASRVCHLDFHPASGRPLWPIVDSSSAEHLCITAAFWTLSQCCATCHTVSLPVTCWWHFLKYITPRMESPRDFQQILVVPRLCHEGYW